MSWEILLNNTPHTFTSEDLPALIHAEKGQGAGLFSLNLLLQLYHQGEPILIISTGQDVKDTFISETTNSNDLGEITSSEDISTLSDKQALFLSVEHQGLVQDIIQSLEDFQERIVYISKFEGLSQETLTSFYGHTKTIYVGDLNTSEAKEPLLQLKYNAKIFFSPLHNDFRLHLPKDLPEHHGYYQGRIDQGTVCLQKVA